ncbi:MAG: hypothetical protein B6241_14720 [Spirochaetaceae bacterium 4572_59]|nr:MAG: hypothetical protein B6241_14720 [Spirochaetaceae bacterium 4572_59]
MPYEYNSHLNFSLKTKNNLPIIFFQTDNSPTKENRNIDLTQKKPTSIRQAGADWGFREKRRTLQGAAGCLGLILAFPLRP